ncbi:MAG TPA: glycoside hydrolase family 38 C-terminal domain-containing protein, partial [Actinomycetota bacterium]|nr:glycoside hydrolase family 38 C-terminal domain-containing protein [Actinomycetota bacterium]
MPLLTIPQRIDRVAARLVELSLWRCRDLFELESWRFNGRPLARGERWPSLEGVVTLHHDEVAVPESWGVESVRLELDVGGEGLLRLTYSEGGGQTWGIDPEHRSWPVRARRFELDVQAVARRLLGRPNPDAALERARLVLIEPPVERLRILLGSVVDAARALGDDEVVDPLLECAERALAALAWPSATEPYLARQLDNPWMHTVWKPLEVTADPRPLSDEERASAIGACDRLAEDLRALRDRYPQRGRLALTGHAHLDVAWLWPLEETRRKAVRTFSTAAGLMQLFDDFRFNASSAQIYSFVEEDDPALFESVRNAVRAGAWEPVGGMWVEPDMNMPCGESIVRQLLYGQRYFESRFGRLHAVCWLPDCFGFTPALPQLLMGAGIDSFLTIKVNWSETNRFPYDLFWWEGLDGSRVLAHTFDNPDVGYNSRATAGEIIATWNNYRGKHRYPESLLSVGYGDGGGGVTSDIIERVHTLADLPAVPATAFSSVHDFFERARAAVQDQDLPTWMGELYLEFHRGTLTTQARTKWLHRRAERELITSEVLAGMVALAGGETHPVEIEPWRVLLRNEFHDVLPGSSVSEVYSDAERELRHVIDAGRGRTIERLDELHRRVGTAGDRSGLFVINPDLLPRPLRVTVDQSTVNAQRVRDGYVVTGTSPVPGLSALTVTDADPAPGLKASAEGLANQYVSVRVAPDGCLHSVFDRRQGREVLDGRGNQLWAYVDKPRAWDAWDVDPAYTDGAEEIVADRPPEVIEEGPHRAALRVERTFRDSRIVQELRLWANSARLDFATQIDWHDRRFLLKARFPVAVRSTHASFETAFGVVSRPTYRNTTWDTAQFEVPGHRFSDLSEPGYGVALLNDGRYGHHAVRNELGLSLLRSPIFPDPRADEGSHRFCYSLYPHAGSWLEGGVLAEAEDLNRPLVARPVTNASDSRWSALGVEGLPLALGA